MSARTPSMPGSKKQKEVFMDIEWKPLDFQSIAALDSPVVELLDAFLESKEAQLVNTLVDAMPHPPNEPYPQLPPPQTIPFTKLPTAIKSFEKKNCYIDPNLSIKQEHAYFEEGLKTLNKAFWEYAEVLEGCATELFQQLDHTGLEQWHERLSYVLETVADHLLHRMEDLVWSIKRLEHQLWRWRLSFNHSGRGQKKVLQISRLWRNFLDPSLIVYLRKGQEFLRTQVQKFKKRYQSYLHLQGQVEPHLKKIASSQVFVSLDPGVQKNFLKLYRLLKLSELNRAFKELTSKEIAIALRNVLSVDKSLHIFGDYYQGLKKFLLQNSVAIKKKPYDFFQADPFAKNALEHSIVSAQEEVRLLGATSAYYRDFLLKAHPDPYVRTRLGFSEGPVGAEPAQTKPLLNLGYEIESLNEWYDQFLTASRKSPDHRISLAQIDPQIQDALHEMGQPLATYRITRAQAEAILGHLKQLDELGSPDESTIPYVGKTLAKMLRADWKYHAVFGIPLFHQIYAIHEGLTRSIEDRTHQNRLIQFSLIIHRLQEASKSHKMFAIEHERELDISDMKGYLQDFLASVQRAVSDQELMPEKRQERYVDLANQLLEYRYLFGNFFYQLRQDESEGSSIRRQFFFVDQYFESVEQKLHELHHRSRNI